MPSRQGSPRKERSILQSESYRTWRVRLYAAADWDEWRRMRSTFWPGQTLEEMEAWLERGRETPPRAAVIVAGGEPGQPLCGFAEVGVRSYAEGCWLGPAAYLEGWWVEPALRGRGVGRALVREVEAWARENGHREMGSDTALDNVASQEAHRALGFEEVERAVLYRKAL